MEEGNMIDKMELQLHEQFAQNYNNTFSTTVTLFCTMVATLYGYGYVFLQSSAHFATQVGEMKNGGCYTLDALIFATVGTLVVLTIMQCICITLGGGQRLEQFVVHSIRERHLRRRKGWEMGMQMFPFGYTPLGKKCLKIIVGIYGEFIRLIFVLQIFVLCGAIWKVCINIFVYREHAGIATIVGYIALGVVPIACCLYYPNRIKSINKKIR